jgi:hypothetical protein
MNLFSRTKKIITPKPATKDDLAKLREELLETPEDKEDTAIYIKWMTLTKEQQKERFTRLSIRDRNRLSRIVNEKRMGQ